MHNQYNKKNHDIQLNISVKKLRNILNMLSIMVGINNSQYQSLLLRRKKQSLQYRKWLLLKKKLRRKRAKHQEHLRKVLMAKIEQDLSSKKPPALPEVLKEVLPIYHKKCQP